MLGQGLVTTIISSGWGNPQLLKNVVSCIFFPVHPHSDLIFFSRYVPLIISGLQACWTLNPICCSFSWFPSQVTESSRWTKVSQLTKAPRATLWACQLKSKSCTSVTENRDAGKDVLPENMVEKILHAQPGQKIKVSYIIKDSWSKWLYIVHR